MPPGCPLRRGLQDHRCDAEVHPELAHLLYAAEAVAGTAAELALVLGAEPAVAHDLQRALAGGAAAEAVARVREPVLVRGAGGEQGGGGGEDEREAQREGKMGEPETPPANAPTRAPTRG